jgi:transcriptional antiterminator/mannitol/fructose-specific phosphotransferase system IIA component
MINQELDNRCIKIITNLLTIDGFMSLQEIALMNDVSRRTVYYDIDRINDLLLANDIEKLNIVRGKGIKLNIDDKEKLNIIINNSTSTDYYFSPKIRVKIIICIVLRRNKEILIEDFMEACNVSRNTVINDIKVVQRKMSGYGLEFVYSNKEGYYILGNVIRKRAVFFMFFNELYKEHRKGQIYFKDEKNIENCLSSFHKIEKELNYEFVDGVLYSLAVFTATIQFRKNAIIFEEKDVHNVINTNEYKLVKKYFSDLSSFEQVYLTLHLLGSRLQNINFEEDSQINEEAYDLACDLVEEFERLATVEFRNSKQLEQSLYYHLKNALYRYRYGILIGNPLLDDIKREYGYLFNVSRKAVECIEQQLAVPIHDSEVAYLTLHFGGALNNQKEEPEFKRILLVCPNGVSTVNMLKAEISYIVRNESYIDIVTVEELEFYDKPYDIIITTIEKLDLDEKNKDKVIVVHPILDDMDRLIIMKKCISQSDEDIKIDKFIKIIKPYIVEDGVEMVKKEIYKFVNKKELNIYSINHSSEDIVHFLQDEDMILFNEKKIKWQESISEVSGLLESKDFVNNYYQKNIIRQLKKYGPYMFISEGVCLAHTKISDGSLKLGLSLGIYPNGIEFERGKLAKLVFVLSAEDQSSHLKMLSDLIKMFDDKSKVNEIIELKTKKEVLKMFIDNAVK